ncbi:unnamed protein product [Amoebophrya sp. A25]|nr:unnamed protein product [Amoebophrya sp. A25]|eukprot:GSA25T00021475001.1
MVAPGSANINEIELTDIDFPAVESATNAKVVLRYLQLLEDDGNMYPELHAACKEKLRELNPKLYAVQYPRATTQDEVEEATKDLFDWEAEVKRTDESLKKAGKAKASTSLPPPRGAESSGKDTSTVIAQRDNIVDGEYDEGSKGTEGYARDKTKMKDYYRNWDQVDIDKMEEDIDAKEEAERAANRERQAAMQQTQDFEEEYFSREKLASLSSIQREQMATSEKEKGNEAFYAADLEEAEMYYSRSLVLNPSAPSVFTNRALVRLKRKKASQAKEDCDRALKLVPTYMKALHRRGKANYDLGCYDLAVRDFQQALQLDPNSAQINGDLREARKMLSSQPSKPVATKPAISSGNDGGASSSSSKKDDGKPTFRRIQIDSDSSDDDEDATEVAEASKGATASSTSSKPPTMNASDWISLAEKEFQNSRCREACRALDCAAAAGANESDPTFVTLDKKIAAALEKAAAGQKRQNSYSFLDCGPVLSKNVLFDDTAALAGAAGGASSSSSGGFKRMQIVEESDSEDDDGPGSSIQIEEVVEGTASAATSSSSSSSGFKRMQIVEESDSEEDDTETAKKTEVVAEAKKKEEQAKETSSTGEAKQGGFKRMQIVEESDSSEDEKDDIKKKDVDEKDDSKKKDTTTSATSTSTTTTTATGATQESSESDSSTHCYARMQIVEESDSEDEAASPPPSSTEEDTTSTSESIVIVDPAEVQVPPTSSSDESAESSFVKVNSEMLKKIGISKVENESSASIPCVGLNDNEDAAKDADPYPELSVLPTEDGVELAKKAGNTLFKEGKFEEARRVFDKCAYSLLHECTAATFTASSNEVSSAGQTAIKSKIQHQAALVKSNSAFASLKAKDYARAEEAATESLELDPTNTKARYRRAQARLQLGETDPSILKSGLADVDAALKNSEAAGLDELRAQFLEKIAKLEPQKAFDTVEPGFTKLEIGDGDEDEVEVVPAPLAPKAFDPPKRSTTTPSASSSSTTKPAADVLAEFEQLKAAANGAFSQGRLEDAVVAYQKCIDFGLSKNSIPKEKIAVVYTNRAVTHYKLGNYEECERDATSSLDIGSQLGAGDLKMKESIKKAVYKRAQSRLHLGRELAGALQDVNRVMEFPENKADFLAEADKLKREILQKMVQLKREQEAEKLRKAAVPARTSNSSSSGGGATTSSSGGNFSTPINAYDFQRVLASLKNQPLSALRNYLLKHVPAKIVPSIFKRSSIETDHLGQVIQALHLAEEGSEKTEYEYLFALGKTYMADLQFGMLSSEEVTCLKDILTTVPANREAEKKAFLKVSKIKM